MSGPKQYFSWYITSLLVFKPLPALVGNRLCDQFNLVILHLASLQQYVHVLEATQVQAPIL